MSEAVDPDSDVESSGIIVSRSKPAVIDGEILPSDHIASSDTYARPIPDGCVPAAPGNSDGVRFRRPNSLKTLMQQQSFLDAYAECGTLNGAARVAGVEVTRHYEWMDDVDKHPDYRARFDAAKERSIERLESEMLRRAVDGYDEPVYGKGEGRDAGVVQVGTIRRYSDRLLEVALRANRPSKYREKDTSSSTGNVNVQVVIAVPPNGRDQGDE